MAPDFQKNGIFNNFNTIFSPLFSKDFLLKIFNYIELNKNHPRLWRADDDDINNYRHPGIETQYAWYTHFKKQCEDF